MISTRPHVASGRPTRGPQRPPVEHFAVASLSRRTRTRWLRRYVAQRADGRSLRFVKKRRVAWWGGEGGVSSGSVSGANFVTRNIRRASRSASYHGHTF
jgi:hypothetical protein